MGPNVPDKTPERTPSPVPVSTVLSVPTVTTGESTSINNSRSGARYDSSDSWDSQDRDKEGVTTEGALPISADNRDIDEDNMTVAQIGAREIERLKRGESA